MLFCWDVIAHDYLSSQERKVTASFYLIKPGRLLAEYTLIQVPPHAIVAQEQASYIDITSGWCIVRSHDRHI